MRTIDGAGGRSEAGRDAERALATLRGPMVEACRSCDEWPAKVAAVIHAVIAFVAASPAGAEAVALLAPGGDEDGRAYWRAVEHFAGLLDAVVPAEARFPASRRGSVAGIATVVADHVRTGRVEVLGQMAPELVQFALLPYLGFDEARQWSERAASQDGLSKY